MLIKGGWRDYFPKSDLLNGFIGDKVALCLDLVSRACPFTFLLSISASLTCCIQTSLGCSPTNTSLGRGRPTGSLARMSSQKSIRTQGNGTNIKETCFSLSLTLRRPCLRNCALLGQAETAPSLLRLFSTKIFCTMPLPSLLTLNTRLTQSGQSS